MEHTSQPWRLGPKKAAKMAHTSQTWRRGPKNAVLVERMKTRGRAICAARRIHPLGPKKAIQRKNYVISAMGRASPTSRENPGNHAGRAIKDKSACDSTRDAQEGVQTGATSARGRSGPSQSG